MNDCPAYLLTLRLWFIIRPFVYSSILTLVFISIHPTGNELIQCIMHRLTAYIATRIADGFLSNNSVSIFRRLLSEITFSAIRPSDIRNLWSLYSAKEI